MIRTKQNDGVFILVHRRKRRHQLVNFIIQIADIIKIGAA